MNTKTLDIAADAAVIFDTANDRVWLNLSFAGREPSSMLMATPMDRSEVVARIHADLCGPRGIVFVDAMRAGDVRAQRRAYREIGKP